MLRIFTITPKRSRSSDTIDCRQTESNAFEKSTNRAYRDNPFFACSITGITLLANMSRASVVVVGTFLLQNLQEMKAGHRSDSNYQFINPSHHPQGHTSAANWGNAENSNVRRVDVKFF